MKYQTSSLAFEHLLSLQFLFLYSPWPSVTPILQAQCYTYVTLNIYRGGLMPTKNPRINATFNPSDAEIIQLICEKKKISMSVLVNASFG
jgi:hypothetical protein